MRKLKTTSEPCETTETALEMQPMTTGNGNGDLTRGNTIILNPALHSAAANLTGPTSGGGTVSSRINRSRTAAATAASKTSKNRPPSFVLTKDTVASASGSGNGAITPQPHSASSSIGYHGGHRYFWLRNFLASSTL